MKKQCIKCKGRFNRIDLWKIGESWVGDQYVCRSCRRSYVPEEKPPKKESSLFGKKKCPVCGEEMSKKDVWKAKKFVKEWICLNCNSPQNEMQKPKFHEKTREELEQEQKRIEDEKAEESRIYAEFKKKEQERQQSQEQRERSKTCFTCGLPIKEYQLTEIEIVKPEGNHVSFDFHYSCEKESSIRKKFPDCILSKVLHKGLDTYGPNYEQKKKNVPHFETQNVYEIEDLRRKQEAERRKREQEYQQKQDVRRSGEFDPYKTLGVKRDVTYNEVKTRFKELIKKNNLSGSINMSIQERERKEAVIKDLIKARDMIFKEKGFSN